MNLIFVKNLLNKAKKLMYILVIFGVFASILAPLSPVSAIDALYISNVSVNYTGNTATIKWITNSAATGKVEYGLSTGNYQWTLQTNAKNTEQIMTIQGLFPETTYYFRITATGDTTQVVSVEQNFKTLKSNDGNAPIISNVQILYTTGNTATIQWLTDEEATTEVEYGMTTAYGSSKVDGTLVLNHDVTLTGLRDGTQYHFRVKSKDKDNNISIWYDLTFTTKLGTQTDTDTVLIYDVRPTGTNDANVSQTSAVISWRTNKPAEGWVRYGTSTNYSKTAYANPPRDFQKSLTLTGLMAGTTYYFEITVKDITGKTNKTIGYTFVTKSVDGGTVTPPPVPPVGGSDNGLILGAGNCNVNLSADLGFYGQYYNLTPDHPDFEKWKQTVKPGPQNDWYSSQYFSFERVDPNVEFGANFFPVNEGKRGDPNLFAVHWSSIISVPVDDTYTYKISSDDDSWIYIDGILHADLMGVHNAQTKFFDVILSAGYHRLDIYYADRQSRQAAFTFLPDKKLKIHPLPAGCEIDDVLEYNKSLGRGVSYTNGGSGGTSYGNGIILGASNDDPYRGYACDPDLGYTRIKRLVKTTDSPDIWAILETGQKHYITSPESFNKYKCDWSRIRTISRAGLNRYAYANLVRTPDNATVYRLFQRPQTKWLKINIPSPTVFISYPNNFWGNVARINDLDMAAYPNVKLIKQMGTKDVYLIDGNFKRLIPNETVFKAHNFEWFEVAELNAIHVESYETSVVLE